MKNGYIFSCIAGAILLAVSPLAAADSWAKPTLKEVFSQSREYFVRVIPGESYGDTVGFGGDKKGKYATAEFYKRQQDHSYIRSAVVPLPNPVAPVEFFVSDNGHMATVDNWHNLGYGKVIAIYDANGAPIRSYTLADLFDAEEIKRFPHSVSSIHWRNGAMYLRSDQTTLLVTVRSGADFLFGMESGQYQYCEHHDNANRCRDANQPRKWRSVRGPMLAR